MKRWALLLALCGPLAGCADMVAHQAVKWPMEASRALENQWTGGGFPECPVPLELWVYETSDPQERAELCHRALERPAPAGCLVHRYPPGRPFSQARWVAVVDPANAYLLARHEGWHALEYCAWGVFSYTHTGPHWNLFWGTR